MPSPGRFEVPHAGKEKEKTAAKIPILQTAAAWQPHASCSDSPDLPAAITASMPCVDDLLNSRPFLVALSYSLDLPVKKYGTADLPDSVFEWGRKALSRQHFFTTMGAPWTPDTWCCRACGGPASFARARPPAVCSQDFWVWAALLASPGPI